MIATMTYNNLVDLMANIAVAHKQLRGFGSGELWEIEGNPKNSGVYPELWMVPTSATARENTVEHTIRLLVYDLVHKDETNENDVLSDSLQILLDIVKVLRYESDNYTLLNEPIFEPFTERFSDEVSGWSAEFVIEVNFPNNDCDMPMDAFTSPGVVSGSIVLPNDYLTCGDLDECGTIIDIQEDITNLENDIAGLATVATTGSYTDLINTPNLDFLPLAGGNMVDEAVVYFGTNTVNNYASIYGSSGAGFSELYFQSYDNSGDVRTSYIDVFSDNTANYVAMASTKNFLSTEVIVDGENSMVSINTDTLFIVSTSEFTINSSEIILVNAEPNSTQYIDSNNSLIKAYSYYIDQVNTTNASTTTIATYSVPNNSVMTIRSEVICRKTAGAGTGTVGTGNAYERSVKATNIGGTVTIATTQSDWTSEAIASFNCTYDVSGTTVRLRVTGSANNDVSWKAYTKIININ